jgi:hypothetical protein
MIDELEGVWKKVVAPILRHSSGFCVEGLRKTTEIISQVNRCSGWHWQQAHPACSPDVSPSEPT